MSQPRNMLDPGSENDYHIEHQCNGAENTLEPRPLSPERDQWRNRDGHQDEYTPLLAPVPARSVDAGDGQWDDEVLKGLIDTTWKRETKLLAKSAAPLILTFVLQYSLTVASIFTVGHIGKVELGAVSLAHMTAGITGYSVYYGLATSLDTLCAQAYGSGAKHLVGVHLQRMVYFLLLVSIPITLIWINGTAIIGAIIPERERPVAVLAGRYLRIIALGAPGFAMFEAGKRFVQAQGIFEANMYVLLFCAPLNIFMNWLFVWQFRWGYIGAPIAVAITDNLLPLSLFLYVYFVRGRACWGGFSRAALHNWGPMIRLALPGLLMIVTEFLAFELLTLAASRISASHLAAQSILATSAAMAYQLPWSLSVAASTRVANLIGAAVPAPARVASRVACGAALATGLLNLALLLALRRRLAGLFTDDAEVALLVARALPICIAFQVFDSLTCACNGILRGLGRQEVGGYINISAYYIVAMPISFGTCFGLGWGLEGLWIGPAVGLFLICCLEGLFLVNTSWDLAVDQARKRTALG